MSLRPCIPAMLFVVMLVLAGGMAQAAPDYAGRVVRQLADQDIARSRSGAACWAR